MLHAVLGTMPMAISNGSLPPGTVKDTSSSSGKVFAKPSKDWVLPERPKPGRKVVADEPDDVRPPYLHRPPPQTAREGREVVLTLTETAISKPDLAESPSGPTIGLRPNPRREGTAIRVERYPVQCQVTRSRSSFESGQRETEAGSRGAEKRHPAGSRGVRVDQYTTQ